MHAGPVALPRFKDQLTAVWFDAGGFRHVFCGEPLVDLIDPIEGEVLTLTSPVDGLFFARENRRFAMAGMPLGKVAGREPRRSGSLLSA